MMPQRRVTDTKDIQDDCKVQMGRLLRLVDNFHLLNCS